MLAGARDGYGLARAVSAEIRSLMGVHRVTGRELARATGMGSHNYLAVRLRDEKPFTLEDVEQISRYFETDPTVLIGQAVERAGRLLGDPGPEDA